MALQINAPDFGALNRVAGNSGNLNLPIPGALGLQALQTSNAAQNAALDRQSRDQAILQSQGLQQQQLAQQGLLASQQNQLAQQKMAQQGSQFDVSAALDRDKLAAGIGQQDRMFGLEQQKQGLAEQELAMKGQAMEMAKLADLTKAQIHEKGAFASYARLAIGQAKTPEEANQMRNEILKDAVNSKHISLEEAKAAAQMPLSQFKNSLDYKIMQYGAVNDFKDMMAATKPAADKTGTHIEFNADGSIRSIAQDAAAPVKAQAQKDIMFADDNISELKNMYKNVPDGFFGASALGQPVTWAREWAEKAPIVGKMLGPSKESKDSLEAYSSLQGQSNNMAMNVIKQLSGVQYSDKQLEFMNQILPQIGPGAVKSQFEGRSKNLLRFFDIIKKERQDLLKSGVDVNSAEYKDNLLSKMQTTSSALTGSQGQFEQYRNDPRYNEWSDEKIKKGIAALQGAQ